MALYDGYGKSVDVGSKVDKLDFPIITGTCPYVYIECEGQELKNLGDTKLNATVRFEDGKQKFSLFATVKAQGDNSLNYDQKQVNITLYSDEDRTKKRKLQFNSWMPKDKFHIKSNPQDPLNCRNAVVAEMMQKLMGTRLPEGAWGFIKAFPIVLYWNGECVGCYNWTVPQEGDLYNFSKKKEVALTNLAFRFSGEWRGDSDVTDAISAKWTELSAIMSDTDNLTKEVVEAHFDVTSILQMISCVEWFAMGDCVGDNSYAVTWDGLKWYCLPYDFDWCAWGRNIFDGRKYIRDELTYLPITFLRKCELLYADEIKGVYADLRKNGMNVDALMENLTNYYQRWNYTVRQYELEKYNMVNVNSADRDLGAIRATMTRRSAWCDALYEYTE